AADRPGGPGGTDPCERGDPGSLAAAAAAPAPAPAPAAGPGRGRAAHAGPAPDLERVDGRAAGGVARRSRVALWRVHRGPVLRHARRGGRRDELDGAARPLR